jgi:Ca-activated chloride channel family protein
MEGERITQVKQSLSIFLDQLTDKDYFNIITFGTHIIQFREDLVKAIPENIEDAQDFVYELYALGMTNLSAALDSSLSQSFRDSSTKNLVFLTDGAPTIGVTDPEQILQHVAINNTDEVRIFSFGVGDDIDRSLLTQLSLDNFGYATFISSDDSIALLIENHFKRISKPVMTGLALDYGGLQVWDRYPKNIMDLFWGTQTVELGLYNGSGSYPVTLSGDINGEPVDFAKTGSFPDTVGGYRFVPRLWAKGKIDHLLDLIEIYGETDELVDQIIELSLTFQILTPYTALYVDPTAIEEEPKVVPGEFKLFANYPNPFNPETTIRYNLPPDQTSYRVVIKIYNVLGELIITLRDEHQQPGMYQLTWDGRNAAGQAVPSGVYFLTLEAGKFKASQKLLLVK